MSDDEGEEQEEEVVVVVVVEEGEGGWGTSHVQLVQVERHHHPQYY
jgi:hypothetical protein